MDQPESLSYDIKKRLLTIHRFWALAKFEKEFHPERPRRSASRT